MIDPICIFTLVTIIIPSIIIIILLIYANRYKKLPPDSAMLIYNRKLKGEDRLVRVLLSGGKFIIPFFQRYEIFPMDIRTLEIVENDVITDLKATRIPIDIKAVTQIRPGGSEETVRNGAEKLKGLSDEEKNIKALEIITRHLRSLVTGWEAWAVSSERDRLSKEVQSSAGVELKEWGFQIRALVIKVIDDKIYFFDALGRVRTEEIKRNAIKGEGGDEFIPLWHVEPGPYDDQIALGIYQYASQMVKEGDIERAMQYHWAACYYDPDNDLYQDAYSKLVREAGVSERDVNIKIDDYLRVREEQTRRARHLHDLGMEMFQQGSYTKAYKLFLKAHQMDPIDRAHLEYIDHCRKKM